MKPGNGKTGVRRASGTTEGDQKVKRRALSSTVLAGLATAVLCSAFVGAGADTAQAQGFFERLFNPKYHRMQELKAREELLREKARTVRVSAPKFYTYKPDVWKRVSFAALAEVKTAAVTAKEDQAGEGEGVAADAAPAVLTEFDKARPALKGLDFEMLPEVADALKAFYREHPDFLWIEDGNVNSRALSAKMALADADKEGLNPEDYKVDLPTFEKAGTEMASADDDAAKLEREKALMSFELTFSSAVLTYVLDAERGRVDPDRISGYHDLPRHEVDLVAVLEEIKSKDDLEAYLVSRNPQNAQYAALKKELARLRAQDEEEGQIVIAPGTFLKAGGSSPEMKHIVAAINKNGSDALKEKHADTLAAYAGEEAYTPELVALVKDFQKENKLSADGIVGKNTIKAMVGETNAAKIAKVKLAMERRRWLPVDLGARRVFVNQPAFTATYYEPGKEPYSMRVIVGKKSNQTSFFYDKIELVEYNPYWGVPYSIIVNEMLPKLAQDPSYLDRAGYEVTTVSGHQVSSSSVDWYAVATKQQSINVRQYPGASNALGQVKILFPNSHDIYMHDTPTKSLFNKDVRAFSHGCIRLQDPKGMAAAVLGKSKDYVTGRINQGQNAQEDVTGNIPVYISYFTAWPNDEGTISYFDDIYDRDMYLLKALDITEQTREDARV
ncbi:L,D-transpeptidase family protein [Labrenzia aggregata]|uniref:L,D-transpeptidase family protein n=1 Tax=Roseibium aggregatum TaxID=187304 RepID=A0A926P3X9_9HYPH|nr:L,D-transpeptidase family protein [Roseibium aggregatum]